jgi:hypothetical protein
LRSLGFGFGLWDMAGFIFLSKNVRCPTSTFLQALIIAHQFVYPRTTTIFDFAILQAYSILPKMSSFKTFPAFRIQKVYPKPWSKINSAEVLESIRLRIVAKGNCPTEV